MKNQWTIYCHIHIESGRRYIGLTKKTMLQRWNQHVYSAKSSKGGRWHFPNAIRKYGPEAFSHEVLEKCNTLEEANIAEAKWIDHFDSRNPEKGFNLMKGGESQPHSIRKNPWNNPEYRAKCSKNIKFCHTSESRFKAKLACNTLEHKVKVIKNNEIRNSNPLFRIRCSEAQKGKTLSEDHRMKIARNISHRNALKSVEERKISSKRMNEGRKIAYLNKTDEERQIEYDKRSQISKEIGSIRNLQKPEAVMKHRQKCSKLNKFDINFIRMLRCDGYTHLEIAGILNVSRKTISYHIRKTCPELELNLDGIEYAQTPSAKAKRKFLYLKMNNSKLCTLSDLLSKGYTKTYIAKELCVSRKTIYNYMDNSL